MSEPLPLLRPAAEEFLCVRCARQQKTCCQSCEVHPTAGDVERIRAYTGRIEDFTEFRMPADPSYADQDDDPAWRLMFRADGARRVLRRQANGDCTFLGSTGCTLPLEVRPLICRLYPYVYTEAGIHAVEPGWCPTHLLRPGQGILHALDMSLEPARRWHAQLYRELHHEAMASACLSV